jgi:diguanylate cyclase (GGDEF)-like protein/PAS domain S-box-containing protein
MSNEPAYAATADPAGQPYRSIVAHVKDAVFQLDLEGRITFLNPAWTELTGLNVEATLGARCFDLVAAEDRAFSRQQFSLLFVGRTPFSRHDMRVRLADGGAVWVESWARATRDESGAIVGITGTLRDITERKAIEAAQFEAQESLERGIAQSSVGFFSLDCNGLITSANSAGAKMLGRDVASLVGKKWRKLLHQDSLAAFLLAARTMLAGGCESATRMLALLHGDGGTIYTRMHASLLRDAASTPVEFFCQLEDVTAEHVAEQRLKVAEEHFRVIFQESPTAMCTAQTDGRLIQLNSALLNNLGRPASAFGTAACFNELIHPQDRAIEDALFGELVAGKRTSYECELRIHFPRSSWRWCEVRAKLLDGGVGFPSYVLRTMVDVSKRKRSEDTLRRQAESDSLTGIPNRRAFERIVTDRIAELRGTGSGALFVVDLDGFKAINDTFGHQTGDLLLATIAKALVARLRPSDVVARLGGDEFGVLTPNGAECDMRAVANAMVHTIEKTAHDLLQADLPAVSASVGAARLDGCAGYEALIGGADLAMYRAKRAGGARVAFASRPGQEAAGMVWRIARE